MNTDTNTAHRHAPNRRAPWFRRSLPWLIVVLILSASGFRSQMPHTDVDKGTYFEISKNIDILGKVVREITINYVDDIDPEKFIHVGIHRMLSSLDPYTNFISADDLEDFKYLSTGEYGGIGAGLNQYDDQLIISQVYPDRPAAIAGLKSGDEIIKIDGTSVSAETHSTLDIRNLLRGQPNTKVSVTVKRYGQEQPLTFEVIRKKVKINNVPYAGLLEDRVGYIKLSQFTKDATFEVRTAVERMKEQGMQGLVLDLRSNPGGLLYEAIGISNLFVNKGEKIVETRGRMEGSYKRYDATEPALDTRLPLVVLIDGRSASASEIVAGVIQDLDRGVVLGQRSFGKGLVQSTRELSYNTQLKITTARYYTPSGRCIQAIDYGNRDEEGKIQRTPDSLKAVFLTRNQREVLDAGGIDPDIKLENREYHRITLELIRKHLMYHYATRYYYTHPQAPDMHSFEITDVLYEDFLAFLEEKGFDYEGKDSEAFEALTEKMESEPYFADIEGKLTQIRQQIEENRKNDVHTYREEIAEWLEAEIISRYHHRAGRIACTLDSDPEVEKAVEILSDPNRYDQLLATPGKP